MSDYKIKVLTLRPDSKRPTMTSISPNLENLQRYVGGYIEIVHICADFVVICNEEGRIGDYKYNCDIFGTPFFGNLIFCGEKKGELCDIPIDYKEAKRILPSLWKEEKK